MNKILTILALAILSSCNEQLASSPSQSVQSDQGQSTEKTLINKNVQIKVINQSQMLVMYSNMTYSIQATNGVPSWIVNDQNIGAASGVYLASAISQTYVISKASMSYEFSMCNATIEVQVIADGEIFRTDILSNGSLPSGNCTTRRLNFNITFEE